MVKTFGTIPENIPGNPTPFTLHIPDEALNELRQLIKLSPIGPKTWWNQDMTGQFGVSRPWLTEAKETWLSDFNWRKHEEFINSFPNFKIPIADHEAGSVDIHFAALFSKKKNAMPIIFLHGYPGSFLEFLPMMQLLTEKYTPETLPYHVIVPSLPDYGLSGGASENVEMTLDQAARIMNQLMVDLGFGSGYIAQGGDLGSMLTRIISVQYDACKAFHVNMLVLNPDQAPGSMADLTLDEREHLERTNKWRETGFAYALEHGTRPSTIGLVISSSPLALLAWIGEKHLEWSDPRGPISLDTILSMVTFYWFTSTFPRALYHAELVKNVLAGKSHPISLEKPMGYSLFPYDLVLVPHAWAKETYPNLVLFKTHSAGGHFGGLEQPRAFLEDVEEFVEKVRGTFE
ncbi:Alpha/Beta hydrolase protein [Aspergillus pseudoustus]|uniref:Alpha/Beta hydrolase protein n=1 Tax=Aspergillus pseudoustus TaxID=1810923 RepID=A0ABR4KFI4_9EURO